MARIKKERKGKGRKGKEYTIKTHKRVILHTRVAKAPMMRFLPNFVLHSCWSNLRNIITFANISWYRLKGWHFAAVQNLPFSHDFNGWPYNRQALTCCRDLCIYIYIYIYRTVCLAFSRIRFRSNVRKYFVQHQAYLNWFLLKPLPLYTNTKQFR